MRPLTHALKNATFTLDLYAVYAVKAGCYEIGDNDIDEASSDLDGDCDSCDHSDLDE